MLETGDLYLQPKDKEASKDNVYLFEQATPAEQVHACYLLIYNVIMNEMMGDQIESEAIKKLWELQEKLNGSSLSKDSSVAKALIELTISILDVTGIDLIAKSVYAFRFSYQRQLGNEEQNFNLSFNGKYQGLKEWMFMTKDELEALMQKLPDKVLKSKQPVSMQDLNDIEYTWGRKIDADQISEVEWYVPFLLNDEIGGLRALSFRTKNLYVRPRSELPIQDVLQAYLEVGVSNIGEDHKSGLNRKKENHYSIEEFERDAEELWQFTRASIPQKESANTALYLKKNFLRQEELSLEEIQRIQQQHFEKEFGVGQGLGDVQVVLTRSGVSANATALSMAKEWIGKELIPIWEGIGWYFENNLEFAPDPQLCEADGSENARIVLVNVESNSPTGLLMEEYVQYRNELVQELLNTAHKNPEERFVVIIDKTSDPALKPRDFAIDWPSNVKVIETMSLTKHQRGGRGYFYGVVLSHGMELSDEQINVHVQQSRGTMTPYSWVGLPKVTEGELVRRREKLRERIAVVVNECLPFLNEQGFDIEEYSYYFFLYPKIPLEDRPDFLYLVPNEKKSPVKEVLKKMTIPSTYLNIEMGDSFNLDQTRVNAFYAGFADVEEDTVMRVAPGVATSSAELIRFVKEYVKTWNTLMNQRDHTA